MGLRSKKNLIGLDIGTSSVKAVRLQNKKGKISAQALAYAPLPTTRDSEKGSSEPCVFAVRKCLGQLRVGRWDVVCGLNGEQVVMRPFSFPSLSKAEVPGAVRLEAMQVSPFGLDNAVVDYQLLQLGPEPEKKKIGKRKTTPENLTGILSVAQNQAVQFKRNLAKKSGARCRLMDIDGLALLNAVETLGTGDEDSAASDDPVAVLHVGYSCTTTAISAPGMAPFVRDLPFAGKAIIEAVAEDTGLTRQKVAQALQVAQSLSAKHEMSDKFRAPLMKACGQMVEHVRDTLRYYATQQSAPAPKTILVSGGFAAVPGFVENLDKELSKVSVRLWDPLKQMNQKVDSASGQSTPGSTFAVAVGLAMRVL